jgi:hypothetical protein
LAMGAEDWVAGKLLTRAPFLGWVD